MAKNYGNGDGNVFIIFEVRFPIHHNTNQNHYNWLFAIVYERLENHVDAFLTSFLQVEYSFSSLVVLRCLIPEGLSDFQTKFVLWN
jgi:hypothetical protein